MSNDWLGNGSPSSEFMRRAYGEYEPGMDIDPPDPWFRIKEWGVDKYLGSAPPVDYLIDGILPRAVPAVIAGMGSVGKSMLCLELCIKIASAGGLGMSSVLGGTIPKRGRTVFITSEESQDAIHRRLNSLVREEDKERLKDWFYVIPLSVVGMRALLTAKNGEYQMTEAWHELVEQLRGIPDIALVVLDPMQALVQADMNDPAAAQAFWSAVAELCQLTGATVLLTHHMRKEGSKEVNGPMESRELVRGSTSIVDGARWCYTLYLPSQKVRDSIEQVTGEVYDEMSIVQGCVVKSNDIGMTGVRTFIRCKVSGLLIDRTDELEEELEAHKHLTPEQEQQVFGIVSTRWADGDPFSHHAAAKSRYLGTWMVAHMDITKAAAQEYINGWLGSGKLSKEPHPSIRRAFGLKFNP